jgi:hypothetical protein
VGYTTEFSGTFTLDRPLNQTHADYLRAFQDTRRMARDPAEAIQLPDPVREAVGLPIGEQGGYFVGGFGSFGQDLDASVTDPNGPPKGQPGLWCQWEPSEDGTEIHWNGGEKFYDYVEWLEYLIVHFLHPWRYVLNGEVTWQGEDPSDIGKIIVTNNDVIAKRGTVVYGP